VTVEEAVRARVLSLATVVAIASTRVWMQQLPQSPIYPAVRVTFIDDPTVYHLRGPQGTTPARVQVDCYAKRASGVDTYTQVTDLHAAVDGDGLGTQASGLSGFIGDIGSPPFQIKGCFARGRATPRYDAEELNVLTLTTDYIVWYVRT